MEPIELTVCSFDRHYGGIGSADTTSASYSTKVNTRKANESRRTIPRTWSSRCTYKGRRPKRILKLPHRRHHTPGDLAVSRPGVRELLRLSTETPRPTPGCRSPAAPVPRRRARGRGLPRGDEPPVGCGPRPARRRRGRGPRQWGEPPLQGSVTTAKKQRASLMSKLNVHDLAGLIRTAIKRGLAFLDE
jgi:hypothetical protein